jgi:Site-specific recombinase XerD
MIIDICEDFNVATSVTLETIYALLNSFYVESDYVFTWSDGRLIRPDYVSSGFQKILQRHNLRYIRFHDLRHSCASILISMGYSLKEIQEWLGHSDIKMTGIFMVTLNIQESIEWGRILCRS